MVELTITVRDEEKRLSKKYLIYEPFVCVEHDPIVKDCIDEVVKEFATEPSDIKVKITMEVK